MAMKQGRRIMSISAGATSACDRPKQSWSFICVSAAIVRRTLAENRRSVGHGN
jgi:hypothetical protein